MSISILGGYARNFKINVIDHELLRPTSVMLRRRLFDAHQDLSDYHFIDLCAGTGAMGLEALSRGASLATFVEKNPKFYRTLKETLKSFEEKYSEAQLVSECGDCLGFFKKWQTQYLALSEAEKAKVILFFDPPYEQTKLYEEFFAFLTEDWFCGQLWVEGDRQKNYEIAYYKKWFSKEFKEFTQGTSYILIFDYRR
ncbi:MAG: RsmD family RNA methyltransferase [Bacteriovoracaceae bacterium]|nr:RsmD family RNA methyltransferase [Bacteriovoracaceae bacterium]